MKVEERAKAIKLLILDVDGVLTDGRLYFTCQGEAIKTFYAQDGIGINMLQRSHVMVAIITGRGSPLIAQRAKELKIEYCYQHIKNKFTIYQQLKTTLKLADHQIAMAGDDLPDLKIMLACGLALTVANATPLIKQKAHYATQRKGGRGAVREMCDLIMQAQGTLKKMQKYMSNAHESNDEVATRKATSIKLTDSSYDRFLL